MNSLRQHLRSWAAAWLVFQVASLSALVPNDCCAAHRRAASDKVQACHEQESPASDRATPDETCSMRGSCEGPIAALLRLLPEHGVLSEPLALPPDAGAPSAAARPLDTPLRRLTAPDLPPPRA